AAATKDERIAALEAHDLEVGPRALAQQRVDRRLGAAVLASALTSVDELGIAATRPQHRAADQRIIANHIRLAPSPQPFDGDQVGCARPRGDERDKAANSHTNTPSTEF